MTKRIAVLFCADRKVGVGHFRRCLILIENLKNAGLEADLDFINFRINKEASIIEQHECPHAMQDLCELNELIDTLQTYDLVICDVVISKAYQVNCRFQQLAKHLSSKSENVILIDGVAETTLDPQLFTGRYRAVLQPYFLDKNSKTNLVFSSYYGGPEFALVRRSHTTRTYTGELKRILIATGATTTETIAAYIFQSLSLAKKKIQVSVISHDPSQIHHNNYSKLGLEVIPFDTGGLINVARNFDFVITSSGQSRYELIEANIPFAFFDWNDETQEASNIFSRNLVGRCIYLGLFEGLRDFDFSVPKIAEFCDKFGKTEPTNIFCDDKNWKLLNSEINSN